MKCPTHPSDSLIKSPFVSPRINLQIFCWSISLQIYLRAHKFYLRIFREIWNHLKMCDFPLLNFGALFCWYSSEFLHIFYLNRIFQIHLTFCSRRNWVGAPARGEKTTRSVCPLNKFPWLTFIFWARAPPLIVFCWALLSVWTQRGNVLLVWAQTLKSILWGVEEVPPLFHLLPKTWR